MACAIRRVLFRFTVGIRVRGVVPAVCTKTRHRERVVSTRTVIIRVTSKLLGTYEARSYPHDSRVDPSRIELYRVPVYEIWVGHAGTSGISVDAKFQATRFMPFWNDPTHPTPHYSARGWINAGLAHTRRIVVSRYLQRYAVQNRYSPGRGAIVLTGSFYIHAGPAIASDFGFGSAGCVEIFGDFDDFKDALASLAGGSAHTSDWAIQELINHHRLIVDIERAAVPDIKSNLTRTILRKQLFP
jgi:hypothetical protein